MMPVIVYTVAIILVCAIFVTWFFCSRSKYTKKQRAMLSDIEKQNAEEEKLRVQKIIDPDAKIEDYTLEDEEAVEAENPEKAKSNTFSFTPFLRRTDVVRSEVPEPDDEAKEEENEEDESDDATLEERFKAYERFLREKLSAKGVEVDDEEQDVEEDEEDEEEEERGNLEPNSLEKSREEQLDEDEDEQEQGEQMDGAFDEALDEKTSDEGEGQ